MAEHEVTKSDVVEILASTLELVMEKGLTIGVRLVPESEKRRAGIMIYVAGVGLDNEGNLKLMEATQ